MGTKRLLIPAFAIAGLTAHGAQAAGAEAPPAAPEIRRIEFVAQPQSPVPGDDRPVLDPTTRDYQWTFHVPVVSFEHRRITVTTPSATTHVKRWYYDVAALRDKRLKLWQIPEFSCTYPDLILPNECRTIWRSVYVDVPTLATEHAHADVDVLRLGLSKQFIDIDVPRWTWTEKRFLFSLPALAPPESVERLRASLSGQRAAVIAATDDALARIDREIDALQASGQDPAALGAADGASLDLLAQRQSLLDEGRKELERLASVDAELSLLATQP
jgi:hypothetical protein